MKKPSFSLIKKKVQEAKHILVATHVSADFDAASAALALGRMLKKLGKRVAIFIPSFIEDIVESLPDAKRIQKTLPKEKVELVFGLDHAKVERLGIQEILKRDQPFFIAIDHHPVQTQGGNLQWVDTAKASTTHMLYELAKAIRLPIDRDTSFLLLTGMVSDTDGLTQQNASPEALRVIAELIERGASLSKAQALISEWPSPEAVKAFAYVVSHADIDYRLKLLAVGVKRSEMKKLAVDPGVIDGFANALRMIRGVEIALLLVEQKKGWRGHLRSRSESVVDLGKVAAKFDGGGHFHAAGFRTMLPASKIITKVRELLSRE
jgi:phosphoesterase RecJ-like protein